MGDSVHRVTQWRRRKAAAGGASVRAPLEPCGTYAAAMRHVRAGEPLDAPCDAARKAYNREVQARRKMRLASDGPVC